MACFNVQHEDDDDDSGRNPLREQEFPDESDMDDHDDPELVGCPFCRKSINEEAERCHHCGNYLGAEDEPRNLPTWIKIGMGLVVLLLVSWLVSLILPILV